MAHPSRQDITRLLVAWNQGDRAALDRLTPLVYDELRRLARGHVRRESSSSALQPTELVHETYMRLIDAGGVAWQDRAHFYAIAARVMRRVLVDLARTRGREKRGGGATHIQLEDAVLASGERDVSLLAMDEALRSLAAFDERKSRVVELRFFGGLTVDETAEALGVSRDTVLRDWRVAKVWLLRELDGAPGGAP